MPQPLRLSIVIPFHNEEASVSSVLEACLRVLVRTNLPSSEIIAVDDGSTDRTAELIAAFAKRDARVISLTLSENRGQAAALYRGLKFARGEVIATLDGDGQNNPADLPRMLEVLESSSADLVSGIRADRHDSWGRRTMSRLANGVRGRLLRDGVTDSGCAIKVFRRAVVGALLPLKTLYSFIPALARAGGFTVVECPVDHRERQGGETHYGLGAFLWRPALDMLGVWWFSRRRFQIEPEERGS